MNSLKNRGFKVWSLTTASASTGDVLDIQVIWPHTLLSESEPLGGNSLAVQCLGLLPSTAGVTGSIPGQGTNNPHAKWCNQKKKVGKKKQKQEPLGLGPSNLF